MPTMGEYAAAVMLHMVTHDGDGGHGYSQGGNRWGNGDVETIDALGRSVRVAKGDRDCSSACISAWEALGVECGGATYTGNMVLCMTGTGNFTFEAPSFIAAPGDMYLNIQNHVAMCKQQAPDEMMEFCINENGGILGGREGDQTGRESMVSPFRDFGIDGILHYVGDAGEPSEAPSPSVPELRYRVSADPSGRDWMPEMVDEHDTGGSSDTWAGNGADPIRWIAIGMAGWYQACTQQSGWLPAVRGYDVGDLENGCAGDGSPILAVRCYYETQHPEQTGWLVIEYQCADANEDFTPVMRDLECSGCACGDDYAGDGDGQPVARFRAKLAKS